LTDTGLVFFFEEDVTGPPYTKPWMSVEDQVSLLINRGMAVDSVEEASRWLSVVGYYRLSGYWYPYRVWQEDGPRLDQFYDGVSFGRVTALYAFDRHLKLLVLDALERIEIAMRVKVGHTLGKRGAYAHEDPRQLDTGFSRSPQFEKWHTKVERGRAGSKEDFVVHFETKYDGRLPVWAITEILDFGSLSVLFSGLKGADRNTIAAEFNIMNPSSGRGNGDALAAWFKQLNIVRNIAAHHSRLWNRNLGQRPTLWPLRPIPELRNLTNDQLGRLFGPLSNIAYLLQQVSPGNNWTARVTELVSAELPPTGRQLAEMGFPDDWASHPLWS
jgi:abortive infection bacteriophage resistance protein